MSPRSRRVIIKWYVAYKDHPNAIGTHLLRWRDVTCCVAVMTSCAPLDCGWNIFCCFVLVLLASMCVFLINALTIFCFGISVDDVETPDLNACLFWKCLRMRIEWLFRFAEWDSSFDLHFSFPNHFVYVLILFDHCSFKVCFPWFTCLCSCVHCRHVSVVHQSFSSWWIFRHVGSQSSCNHPLVSRIQEQTQLHRYLPHPRHDDVTLPILCFPRYEHAFMFRALVHVALTRILLSWLVAVFTKYAKNDVVVNTVPKILACQYIIVFVV